MSIGNALLITGLGIVALSVHLGYVALIVAYLTISCGIFLRQRRARQVQIKEVGGSEEGCCLIQHGISRKHTYASTILAGFLSSSCCTVPIIIILAIGAGSAAFAASFVQYTPVFLASGILFIVAILLYHIKKMNTGSLSIDALKRGSPLILRSLLIFIVFWAVMTYGITPLVAGSIYDGAIGEDSKLNFLTNSDNNSIAESNVRLLKLKIDGMYCPSCIYSEKSVISALDGVLKTDVRFGSAEVIYNSKQITAEEIAEAATYYVFKARIESDTLMK